MTSLPNRRFFMQAGAAGLLASAMPLRGGQAQTQPGVKFDVFASELKFPEGPVLSTSGNLIVSELGRRAITLIRANGRKEQLAAIDGIPCGMAMGPDGWLYYTTLGRLGDKDPSFIHGEIQRFNFKTHAIETVVDECDEEPLMSPDDLVFDQSGGFYFTDVGSFDRESATLTQTGIYYFDGKVARRVVGPVFPTNGLGLSPSGDRLYWTEYLTGRLFARKVIGPGKLAEPERPHGDCLYIHPTPITYFDSLKVDAEGCLSIAVHDGTPTGKSGIMSFNPDGEPIEFVPFPDTTTTNIAISWTGPKVAYVTLGAKGQVAKLPWPRAGLPPRYPLPKGF